MKALEIADLDRKLSELISAIFFSSLSAELGVERGGVLNTKVAFGLGISGVGISLKFCDILGVRHGSDRHVRYQIWNK